MWIVCLIALALLVPPLQAEDSLRKYKALNFPGDSESFVSFLPDMTPYSKAFSFCGWLRKDGSSAGWPILLSYGGNELRMQDNGGHNCIYGACTRLANKFTVPLGNWFHYCATWSSESRQFREYIDGEMIASRATAQGRHLPPGLSFTLGNWGDGGLEGLQLEGLLFNFNFIAREFSREEVVERAGDMCELKDEEGVYSLSWVDILGEERNGTVTEVVSECLETGAVESRLEEARKGVEQVEASLSTIRDELDNILDEVETETTDMLEVEHGRNISCQVEQTSHLNKKRERLTKVSSLLNKVVRILQGGEKKENLSGEKDETLGLQKDKAASKWDFLYSDSYFNKEFTPQQSEKLRSSWDNICGN